MAYRLIGAALLRLDGAEWGLSLQLDPNSWGNLRDVTLCSPVLSLVDSILGELDGVLASRYAEGGRPSIPPKRLLRAALRQVVYSVRSERLLMEQLNDIFQRCPG